MVPDNVPFADLLARARLGDPQAIADLVREYEPEVRMVARLRIGPALRPYIDSVDLVQSVHRSLMMGLRDNRFQLNGPKDLVALAVTVVRRKAARHWRKARRQARDSGLGAGNDSLADILLGLSSPDNDPAGEIAVRDTIDRMCKDLDLLERTLLEFHLQGYRTADIARELGQNPDVLRVKMSRLRAKLRASGLTADWI